MKISIITVTYNSGTTLYSNIESILNQTYPNYEHIIVDGNSVDNTINIIKKYEPQYKGRLKWISEPDKGLYYAMNKGIEMSTGDIVGVLNSDDFFTSKDILEKIKDIFRRENIDCIYGDIHYVNPSNLNKCVRYYTSRTFRVWMMRMGFMPAHPSFYCKKSIYRDYGSFDTSLKVGADFELVLRYLYVNKIKNQYIPLDFATMRTGGISTSGFKIHKIIMKERLLALKKHKIFTNRFLLSLRYPYKIIEIILTKLGIQL